MGTPLTPTRLLSAAKIHTPLSRLSPNVGDLSKKWTTTSPKKIFSQKNVSKQLQFCAPPVKLLTEGYNFYLRSPENAKIKQEIEIKVSDYESSCYEISEQSLLINTPNKNKILESGLCEIGKLAVLGKGSFGTVVRGKYKGQEVAIKVIKDSTSSLREANALSLRHENVIKLIDIVCHDRQSYGIIVMEYIKSCRQLQSVLDDTSYTLNQESVLKYALDISRGLLYCHEKGVFHLDVKPSNVLVCANGLCKLCDFGNSVKLVDGIDSFVYQGTVTYTAPELLSGKLPTSKCDVYSLGILLWQLRYRQLPYAHLDARDVVIYKVVKFGLRPATSFLVAEDTYDRLYIECWSTMPCDRPEMILVVDILAELLK